MVKRYSPGDEDSPSMYEDGEGDYVRHDDYAPLAAAARRLVETNKWYLNTGDEEHFRALTAAIEKMKVILKEGE